LKARHEAVKVTIKIVVPVIQILHSRHAVVFGDIVTVGFGDGVAFVFGDGVAVVFEDGVAVVFGDGVAKIFQVKNLKKNILTIRNILFMTSG
jgi:hypothetical protein